MDVDPGQFKAMRTRDSCESSGLEPVRIYLVARPVYYAHMPYTDIVD